MRGEIGKNKMNMNIPAGIFQRQNADNAQPCIYAYLVTPSREMDALLMERYHRTLAASPC
jgi:hypothetical protein